MRRNAVLREPKAHPILPLEHFRQLLKVSIPLALGVRSSDFGLELEEQPSFGDSVARHDSRLDGPGYHPGEWSREEVRPWAGPWSLRLRAFGSHGRRAQD